MGNSNPLKGKVLDKFGSVRKFAAALGWNYGKTNRIVRGTQEATVADIRAMAPLLVSSVEELVSVFSLS